MILKMERDREKQHMEDVEKDKVRLVTVRQNSPRVLSVVLAILTHGRA